ncbi:MAG: hypothetical protein HY901_10005 [Deltaproteobacteria bacterium]|nr:hypothetical protein [Deltaproteobacteria bacterium]
MIRLPLTCLLAFMALGGSDAALARGPSETVQIAVAVRDIPVGAVLKAEDIKVVDVPAEYVTIYVVKGDSTSYVIGQRTGMPLLKGDFLRWAYFDSLLGDPAKRAFPTCAKALNLPASAAEQVARVRQAILSREP